MSLFILVMLFLGVVLVIAGIFASIYGARPRSARGGRPLSQKEREKMIVRSKRKIEKNPQNYRALLNLANIYFESGDFHEAMRYYSTIYSMPSSQLEPDFALCALRLGLSAMQLEKYETAIAPLEFAATRFPSSFDVQYALGIANIKKRNFLRASVFLTAAQKINPDSKDAKKQLAMCFFHQGEFQKAIPHLQTAVSESPEDLEITFALATSFFRTGVPRSAQHYFERLKDNPQYGARSCLILGDIASSKGASQSAFDYYSNGLRYVGDSTDSETRLSLIYGTACHYLAQSDIGSALEALKKIIETDPDFKNSQELFDKYTELNQNTNLRVFEMGTNDEFWILCKAIILKLRPREHVKFQQRPVFSTDFLEILAEVTSDSHENTLLARFYRERRVVGDVAIRDFYAKMREIHAANGYCFSIDSFSDEARAFCEGRQVFLWDRDKLLKLMNDIAPFERQSDAALPAGRAN